MFCKCFILHVTTVLVPYSLIVLLTPKHVTLNDFECRFCVKFCFAPVCFELWSLAFEAWLLLNCYWMLSANFKPKRTATAAASRGFLQQHGFLVFWINVSLFSTIVISIVAVISYRDKDYFTSLSVKRPTIQHDRREKMSDDGWQNVT